MSSDLRSTQADRIIIQCFRAGEKGVRETQIVYLEGRHHGFGEVFIKDTLEQLVEAGKIRRTVEGPRRFKTESTKERYRIVRYHYVHP